MVDGAEFWINCKRQAFLSSFSTLQVIQNSPPYTIVWHQCDIWMIGLTTYFKGFFFFFRVRKNNRRWCFWSWTQHWNWSWTNTGRFIQRFWMSHNFVFCFLVDSYQKIKISDVYFFLCFLFAEKINFWLVNQQKNFS